MRAGEHTTGVAMDPHSDDRASRFLRVKDYDDLCDSVMARSSELMVSAVVVTLDSRDDHQTMEDVEAFLSELFSRGNAPQAAYLYTQGMQSGCVNGLRQLEARRMAILARQLDACDSETTVTLDNVRTAIASLERGPGGSKDASSRVDPPGSA